MSKGTNDSSRWCAWKWARTPEAPATRATARPTAIRAAASLLVALACATSCSRSSPQSEYDLVWKTYQRGELAAAGKLAAHHAARYAAGNSLWHWNFRLLQAEALTQLGQTTEAEAL